TQSTLGSAVCQWLAGYLQAPDKIRVRRRGDPEAVAGIVAFGGDLYVRTTLLVSGWEEYETNVPKARATLSALQDTLASISHPDAYRINYDKVRRTYRKIRRDA